MKKQFFTILGVLLGIIPGLVLAQASGKTFLDGWTRLLRFVMNSAFPILISLAGLTFIFQVTRFIIATTADQSKKEDFKRAMFFNLFILFVLTTVFGLIKLLASLFSVQLGVDITTAGVASTACNTNTIRGIFMCLLKFISGTMIPTAAGIAALVFMWNMVVYMTKTDNEAERTNARQYIMWSLGALALMLTMFSILNIGTGTLFGSSSFIPQFPTSSNK